MLANKEEYWNLLRCPKTNFPLKLVDSHLITDTVEANQQYEYPIINQTPVLVDFSQSVLDQTETLKNSASSVVIRPERKGIQAFIKKVLTPEKKVTDDNIQYLISLLKNQTPQPRILMIGGGSFGRGMKPFYEETDLKVIGFDIYTSPLTQFVADAHQIPLANESIDCVIIQVVLEHVLDPHQVVAEIYRVLKPNGLVYSETPFLQQVHEGAYDFTRFTESGHRYLFKNFALIKSGATEGPGTQLLWTIDYFTRSLFRSRAIGKIFKLFFFWVQYLDNWIPQKYWIDSGSDMFFMGRKSDRVITPKEIIHHYQGAQ
ncbi:MAG: class I SAM-dependent methyltransferase [Snowella sp.]|nr:class I SAM-dependent methyltransferase [Snowella sp.]